MFDFQDRYTLLQDGKVVATGATNQECLDHSRAGGQFDRDFRLGYVGYTALVAKVERAATRIARAEGMERGTALCEAVDRLIRRHNLKVGLATVLGEDCK